MLESLFNKVAGLKACKFIKNRLQHRRFPVNIAKFLRTISYRTPLVTAPDAMHLINPKSHKEHVYPTCVNNKNSSL